MTIMDKTKLVDQADAPGDISAGHEAVTGQNGDISGGSKPNLASSSPSVPAAVPAAKTIAPATTASNQNNSTNITIPSIKRIVGVKRKASSSPADLFEPRPINVGEELAEALALTKRIKLFESSSLKLIQEALNSQEGNNQQSPSKSLKINIKPVLGEAFTISIADDSYVFELKEMIGERTGLTLNGIVLSFCSSGKSLSDDEKTLAEAGIQDGSNLNLTVKVSSGLEATIPAEYEFDDGSFTDDGSSGNEEYYDVVCPVFDESGNKPSEAMYDFIRMLGAQSPSSTMIKIKENKDVGKGVDSAVPAESRTIHITVDGSSAWSKLLESSAQRPAAPVPDMSSIEKLDTLKISSGKDDEEEDKRHEEFIKTALGPRGAAIFKSPSLTPVEEPTIKSTLTGSSCCSECGKKCKLTQRFECKCGRTFCPQHRYYDQHSCTFDFKAKDRELVERSNPKVVKAKIDPI